MSLNTLERDDLLRRIAWLNAEVDKIKRMLKGEQMGTARIADAAITNAKISDLTWDKAQGGTATLGGLNNVDGVLSVLDNAGVEKVVLDKDGLLIKSGKLEIQNDGDVVTMDAKGIRSTSNFTKISGGNASLNQSIPTTAGTDVTGATLTLPTLDRDTVAFIFAQVTSYLVEDASNKCNGFVSIFLNGNEASETRIQLFSGSITGRTGAAHYLVTLPAGTHTVKLRAVVNVLAGTTATMTVYGYNLSYALLGT